MKAEILRKSQEFSDEQSSMMNLLKNDDGGIDENPANNDEVEMSDDKIRRWSNEILVPASNGVVIPDDTLIMGLVTSLANAGSLTEAAPTMTQSQLFTVFKHYSKTLKCMSELGYQHRDIKNDNLMVSAAR